MKTLALLIPRLVLLNLVLLCLGLSFLTSAPLEAATVTKSQDPPGYISVDGTGAYGLALPSLTFDSTDFSPNAVVTDVNVRITWVKTDGSCPNPGPSNAFHDETSFRLDGPDGIQVILAEPGTWTGDVPLPADVTTTFDQSAASIPSGTPVSGTFLPNGGNLDSFDGLRGISTWTLRAGDSGAGDPLCVDRYAVTVEAGVSIANLAITKTDGAASAIPGGSTTYTITARNLGPGGALGTTIMDDFPTACTTVTLKVLRFSGQFSALG